MMYWKQSKAEEVSANTRVIWFRRTNLKRSSKREPMRQPEWANSPRSSLR